MKPAERLLPQRRVPRTLPMPPPRPATKAAGEQVSRIVYEESYFALTQAARVDGESAQLIAQMVARKVAERAR